MAQQRILEVMIPLSKSIELLNICLMHTYQPSAKKSELLDGPFGRNRDYSAIFVQRARFFCQKKTELRLAGILKEAKR